MDIDNQSCVNPDNEELIDGYFKAKVSFCHDGACVETAMISRETAEEIMAGCLLHASVGTWPNTFGPEWKFARCLTDPNGQLHLMLVRARILHGALLK